MKRILSTLLLLLMLIVGLQPTMAMHYCGDNLYFVGIFDNETPMSCQTEDSAATDKSSCCNHHPLEGEAKITHEGCCDFHQIELSTDDFQSQERLCVCNSIYHPMDILPFSFPSWIDNITLKTVEGINLEYPPKGFEYLNVDILTSISILRI